MLPIAFLILFLPINLALPAFKETKNYGFAKQMLGAEKVPLEAEVIDNLETKKAGAIDSLFKTISSTITTSTTSTTTTTTTPVTTAAARRTTTAATSSTAVSTTTATSIDDDGYGDKNDAEKNDEVGTLANAPVNVTVKWLNSSLHEIEMPDKTTDQIELNLTNDKNDKVVNVSVKWLNSSLLEIELTDKTTDQIELNMTSNGTPCPSQAGR